MFNKNLAIEHGPDGVLLVAMHPGGVATDMSAAFRATDWGKKITWLSTEESVKDMMKV